MNKDRLTLGGVQEVIPVNFTNMGWEAEPLVKVIHEAAMQELLRRPVLAMYDWTIRTKNMLNNNSLDTIGSVVKLTRRDVMMLNGCGYITKREIFDIFFTYGIRLPHWEVRSILSHRF